MVLRLLFGTKVKGPTVSRNMMSDIVKSYTSSEVYFQSVIEVMS